MLLFSRQNNRVYVIHLSHGEAVKVQRGGEWGELYQLEWDLVGSCWKMIQHTHDGISQYQTTYISKFLVDMEP